MTDTTSRMQFPYPSLNQEPHYDAMSSFFSALDAAAYAYREDRQIILQEGGPVLFTVSTSVLEWGSDIEILAPITGFQWVISAGQVTLDDAKLFYVELTRAPSGNVSVTPVVASQVPSSDAALVIGIRRGSRVYLRNGSVLLNGVAADTIASGSVGGGSAASAWTHYAVVSSGPYTAEIHETVKVDPTGGGFTVTLPTAVGNAGFQVKVVNVTSSTNTVTVQGTGGQTINGSASWTLTTPYEVVLLESDGSNWLVVG